LYLGLPQDCMEIVTGTNKLKTKKIANIFPKNDFFILQLNLLAKIKQYSQ